MGQYDSSKTRVAPVFDTLIARDNTGASWVDSLLALGSRADIVSSIPRSLRLVAGHGCRWGNLEVALPAPQLLLEHLVQHLDPMLVQASRDKGETLARRMELARQHAPTIATALQRLRSGERGKKWFVLEGDSRPDALLETPDVVICIEGKRTEAACTTSTSWMRRRSQLIRHMDAALDVFPNRRILGMLVVEGFGGAEALDPSDHWIAESNAQYEGSMLDDSLPHRTPEERARVGGGVLGVTTWQFVCNATGVTWSDLPSAI